MAHSHYDITILLKFWPDEGRRVGAKRAASGTPQAGTAFAQHAAGWARADSGPWQACRQEGQRGSARFLGCLEGSVLCLELAVRSDGLPWVG